MRMWLSLPRGSCESPAYLLVPQPHTLAGPFCNKVAGRGTKQEEVAGVRGWDCCVASNTYYPSLGLLNSSFCHRVEGSGLSPGYPILRTYLLLPMADLTQKSGLQYLASSLNMFILPLCWTQFPYVGE